jgi:polyisoprenoid-binding protein YceI
MNTRTRIAHSMVAGLLFVGVFAAPTTASSEDGVSPPPSGMTFAPIAPGGMGLEVPDAAAQRGTVYHLLPGRAVQATFTSTTPIETFQGETDGIIGFAVLAPPMELEVTLSMEAPAERGGLLSAEFALPVEQIRTGIDMRDRHLLNQQWLAAADHPHIRFRLAYMAGATDATPDNAPEGSRTFRGELVGDMTIRGITRPIRLENVSIALLPESEATRRVAPGDLMALRCRYTLSLPDFGIDNPIVGRQVARSIEVDQVLYFSTVPPQPEEESSASPEESGDTSEDSPSDPTDAR